MTRRLLLITLATALCVACSVSRHSTAESYAESTVVTAEADTSAVITSGSTHTVSAAELLATLSGLRLSLVADSITGPSGFTLHSPRLELQIDSAATRSTSSSEATARDTTAAMASHHRTDSIAGNSHSGTTTDTKATAPDLPAWIVWSFVGILLLIILSIVTIIIRNVRKSRRTIIDN